jgi:hypothetical protein
LENTGKHWEKIWKLWKKAVKWYGKYGRKASRIVIRYEKYRRKASWIVKWFRKYRRKLWNGMENMKERQAD